MFFLVWNLLVDLIVPKWPGMFQNWILTLHGTETLPRRVDSYKRQSTRSDSSGTYGSTGDDGADHSHSLADNPTNWNDEYYGTCHSECFNGCDGPLASDCYKCLHYRDRNTEWVNGHFTQGNLQATNFRWLPIRKNNCKLINDGNLHGWRRHTLGK